jgi:hypothetical protein
MMSSLLDTIEVGLTASLNAAVVHELLEAYVEAKKNFYLGGLRLSAVEGGRFCEAAYRLLEERTTGTFTRLGKQLNVETIQSRLSSLPAGSHPDAIRLHIPRALRVIYDIRNNRDAAHLADGIDPNKQDATIVISNIDWVLAEFVRLYHTVSPSKAHEIVESLVTRKAPAVQDFDGFLKVLNPKLRASDYLLLLLYERGAAGASLTDLTEWSKPSMRSNLKRTLEQLVNDRAFIHSIGSLYLITQSGMIEVERRKLYEVTA